MDGMTNTFDNARPTRDLLSWEHDVIARINKSLERSRLRKLWGPLTEVLWIERIVLWTIDLAGRRRQAGAVPQEVAFSWGTEQTIQQLAQDDELGFSRQDRQYYSDLLKAGNRLLVGTAEGAIVFHALVVVDRMRMYTTYFLLEKGEVFISRCFTRRDCRRRGIYASALDHICATYAREGFGWALLGIASHNEFSMRGALKAGAIPSRSSFLRLRLLGRDLILPRGDLRERFE